MDKQDLELLKVKAKRMFPYNEENIIIKKNNNISGILVRNMVYYSALPEVLYDLGLNDKDKNDPIVRTITVLKQELSRYQLIYGRL